MWRLVYWYWYRYCVPVSRQAFYKGGELRLDLLDQLVRALRKPSVGVPDAKGRNPGAGTTNQAQHQ